MLGGSIDRMLSVKPAEAVLFATDRCATSAIYLTVTAASASSRDLYVVLALIERFETELQQAAASYRQRGRLLSAGRPGICRMLHNERLALCGV